MAYMEDLEKLADLRNRGIISQEAFEQKKNAILWNNLEQKSNPYSPKSRRAFALLAFFFGFWGVHNFYLGRIVQGVFQLLPWLFLTIAFFIAEASHNIFAFIILLAPFILVFLLYPFWIGLNLLLTRKDGKGLLLNQNGLILCRILGTIYLLIIPFIIFINTSGINFRRIRRHSSEIFVSSATRQANQVLDYVSRCAVAAQTLGDGYIIGKITKKWNEEKNSYDISVSDTTCGELLRLEQAPMKLYSNDFVVFAAKSEDTTFKIETPPISSEKIRAKLITHQNINVEIKEKDNNKMEFIFRK